MRCDNCGDLPTQRSEYIALVFLGLTPFIMLGQVYALALHATLWLGRWPTARLTPSNLLFGIHMKIVAYSWFLYPVSPVLLATAGLGFLWLQGKGVRVGVGVILFVVSALVALNIENVDPGGAIDWFASLKVLGACRGG